MVNSIENTVCSEANSLLQKYELQQKGWSFSFDNARVRAGNCNFSDRKISLSRHFVRQASAIEITDTLLHEIAHAIVGSAHGHDQVWKRKAKEIGCNGQRCHNLEFSIPPYLKKCENHCWQVPAFRRNRKIHLYRCKRCDGKVLYVSNPPKGSLFPRKSSLN